MMFSQLHNRPWRLRFVCQLSGICQFVDRFQPYHRHFLTIYGRSSSSAFFCLLIALVAVGQPQHLQSQATDMSAPQPTAKTCGAPPARGIRVNEEDALSSLKHAVSTMDPTGVYRSTKKLAIAGELSDFNWSQHSTKTVGTFRIQEDHTVANGNFSREFVVDGVSSSLSRTNGQISSTSSTGVPNDVTKNLFTPKSYFFPLAVLQDELENKNVVAYSVLSSPGTLETKSLESFQHIVVVNLSDTSTARNEVEDWYLDPKTHLPVLIRHELPTLNSSSSGRSYSCVAVYTHFGDYQNVSGVLIPTSVYTQQGGSSVRTATIQTLKY